MPEAVLLSVTRVSTHRHGALLSRATGFFFETARQLYVVTNRHVLRDEASGHYPDALSLSVHSDPSNLASWYEHQVPLVVDGRHAWHELDDPAGPVDIAALPIDRAQLPPEGPRRAFTPADVQAEYGGIDVGTPVSIVGFPMGFHDALHGLPVVRQATIASSYGVRFGGEGVFLTDARTHRGSSGAPVVCRRGGVQGGDAGRDARGRWRLLGVHAARLDVGGRDPQQDESLGLNRAWYADVLTRLP